MCKNSKSTHGMIAILSIKKNRISMNRLLAKNLPDILAGTASLKPQNEHIEPTYFPKRSEDDGRVLWLNQDMSALHNHVRCQTRPFPGAFSHLNGRSDKFYFWRVQPFDAFLTYPEALPGEIVEVFHDESFLVATWDGTVLVTEFDGSSPVTIGDRFTDHPMS